MENPADKYETLEALVNDLIFKVKAGRFDIELTPESTYHNQIRTGKIVFGFKSCMSTHYKNLINFCTEKTLKYNVMNIKKSGIIKLRTVNYSMEQWIVSDKHYSSKTNDRWNTNYLVIINFKDLYYN
jgi:hypothetical protein